MKLSNIMYPSNEQDHNFFLRLLKYSIITTFIGIPFISLLFAIFILSASYLHWVVGAVTIYYITYRAYHINYRFPDCSNYDYRAEARGQFILITLVTTVPFMLTITAIAFVSLTNGWEVGGFVVIWLLVFWAVVKIINSKWFNN